MENTFMKSTKWHKKLDSLLLSFPYPWLEPRKNKIFIREIEDAINKLNRMRYPGSFNKSQIWRSYLGHADPPNYLNAHRAFLPQSIIPTSEVIDETLNFFHGMPVWAHPQCMANVLSVANSTGLIASILTNILSPNLIEGEFSWNIARSELETIAMMSTLIGWNPKLSGGVFTFGGTGCYLYAYKLALTHVLGQKTRYRGIKRNGVVLVSKEAHYAKMTCADWTGLGINNVIEIDVDENNALCMSHLQQVMDECIKKNVPIILIVATMGTTDAFAIDPIHKIRKLIDSSPNIANYPKPLLYADAVIGWPWLVFRKYDFIKNPLGFSSQALFSLKKSYHDLKYIRDADMVGIDFHKTGWAAYTSSLFIVKSNRKLIKTLAREKPAYITTHTSYNPFLYTLETSRSAAPSVSAWATLKHFGYEGYQVLLGRIIEVKLFFNKLIMKENSLVCINLDNHGLSTLFRVYPSHINAKSQYDKELHDPSYKDQLLIYNKLQRLVANKLFAMLYDKSQQIPGWENSPYISFSSGYRPPIYDLNENNHEYWIYGIKSFPMSPYSNELSMLILRNYILKARDLVIGELINAHKKKNLVKKNNRKKLIDFAHWFGKNDMIALKYLVGTSSKSPSINVPPVVNNKIIRSVTRVQLLEMLISLPYFYRLPKSNLIELIKLSKIKKRPANYIICKEGALANYAYFIISGKVVVYKSKDNYSEKRILATFGPGSFLGEMALFEKGTRSANIKTTQNTTILYISGNIIINFLRRL